VPEHLIRHSLFLPLPAGRESDASLVFLTLQYLVARVFATVDQRILITHVPATPE